MKLRPLRVRRYSTLGRNDRVVFSGDETAFHQRLQLATENAGSYFLRPHHASQKTAPDLAIAVRRSLRSHIIRSLYLPLIIF